MKESEGSLWKKRFEKKEKGFESRVLTMVSRMQRRKEEERKWISSLL